MSAGHSRQRHIEQDPWRCGESLPSCPVTGNSSAQRRASGDSDDDSPSGIPLSSGEQIEVTAVFLYKRLKHNLKAETAWRADREWYPVRCEMHTVKPRSVFPGSMVFPDPSFRFSTPFEITIYICKNIPLISYDFKF